MHSSAWYDVKKAPNGAINQSLNQSSSNPATTATDTATITVIIGYFPIQPMQNQACIFRLAVPFL